MNTTAITSDWVGRVVDEMFPLVKWLGGSEQGGVFLTEIEGPRAKKAAIKIIPAEAGDAEARLALWAAAMKLSHPHLMSVFRAGRCRLGGEQQVYVVTDYAEEILSEVLPERPITSAEAGEMIGPVLDALSYLHRNGFVHGYLRPSNIMVVDNRLKLSGDSLSIAGKHRKGPSELGVYDAPELAQSPISPAADMWSLGVTLAEALTQHAELDAGTANGEPHVPESIPQPFADIVRHCLARVPARRWSPDDIKARLEAFRAVPGPAGKAEEKRPAKKRSAAPIVAGLVVVIVAVLVIMRPHPAERPAPAAAEAPAQPSAPATAAAPSSAEPQPAAPAAAGASATSPAAVPSTPPAAPAARGAEAPAVKGQVAQRVLPEVLPEAQASIQGKVKVAVHVDVDAQGNVADASLASAGPSKYFANLALEAARKWKFQPAQARGRPVPSEWILRFQFRQDAIDVAPAESSP